MATSENEYVIQCGSAATVTIVATGIPMCYNDTVYVEAPKKLVSTKRNMFWQAIFSILLIVQVVIADSIPKHISSIDWQSAQDGDLHYDKDSGLLVKVVKDVSEIERNLKRVRGNLTIGDTQARGPCPHNPITRNWVQTQQAGSGEWWTAWRQVPDTIMQCDKGSGSTTLEKSWSQGYSISNDIGISIGEVIQLALGAGLSLEVSHGYAILKTCDCDQSLGVACIWEQHKMGWTDTQRQDCYSFENCEGAILECSPWSAYQHTDAPIGLNNQENIVVDGCSQGWDSCNK